MKTIDLYLGLNKGRNKGESIMRSTKYREGVGEGMVFPPFSVKENWKSDNA